jgi:hypothetical protein
MLRQSIHIFTTVLGRFMCNLHLTVVRKITASRTNLTVIPMSSRNSANSSLHSPDLRVLTVNGMDTYWKEIEPYISKLDKIKQAALKCT